MGAHAAAWWELNSEPLADYVCRWAPQHLMAIEDLTATRTLLLNVEWMAYRKELPEWPEEVRLCWWALEEDPTEPLIAALDEQIFDNAHDFSHHHVAVAELIEDLGNPFQASRLLGACRDTLVERDAGGDDLLLVLGRLGDLQQQADLTEERLDTVQQLLSLVENEYDDEELLLETQTSLVSALTSCGRFDEALALSADVCARAQEVYVDHLEERIDAMAEHADTLHWAEQSTEALEIYEEIIEMAEAELGPNDPRVLEALKGMALCFGDIDPYSIAPAEILRDVVQRTEQAEGPDAHEVSVALHQLGLQLYETEPDEAEAVAHRAEQICAKLWGPEHPTTLDHADLRGQALLSKEEPEQALAIFERSLKARTQQLGEDNPQLKDCWENLANALTALERYDEAIAYVRRVLAMERELSGADHPDLIFVLGKLSVLQDLAGREEDAAETFAKAEQLVSGTDPVRVNRRMNLYEEYGLQRAEILEDGDLQEHCANEGMEAAILTQDGGSFQAFTPILSWNALEEGGPEAASEVWAQATAYLIEWESESGPMIATLGELLEFMDEYQPNDSGLVASATTLFRAVEADLSEWEEITEEVVQDMEEYRERIEEHKGD